MPRQEEVNLVFDWLRAREMQFDIVRQFIFDQVEAKWRSAHRS
jgi:hypothetical protein